MGQRRPRHGPGSKKLGREVHDIYTSIHLSIHTSIDLNIYLRAHCMYVVFGIGRASYRVSGFS